MCSEDDAGSLSLTAAGYFESITLYNLRVGDPACRSLCPVSYLTQVFRTGRAMVGVEQTRRDEFYSEDPKSLMCLPILHQGHKAGVSRLVLVYLKYADG